MNARKQSISDMTLEQILLEKEIIDQSQLMEIERVRSVEGGGWAGHFLDAGMVTENELLLLAINDAGAPYIPILQVNVDIEMVRDLSIEYLEEHEAIPIDAIGTCMTLATPNPFQPELVRNHHGSSTEVLLFSTRVGEWRECIRSLKEKIQSENE